MGKLPKISKEEKFEWTLNFLKQYALKQLREKYLEKKAYINYDRIGKDQRRTPTIEKYFKSINLITEDYDPIDEEIEKIIHLPEYNKCPDLKDYLYLNSRSYGSKRIIMNNKEAFEVSHNYKRKEQIYIYNNQDQFMFSSIEDHLLITSKELYDNINEHVLKAYAKIEIDEDPNSVLSYALGIRFRTLDYTDYFIMDKEKVIDKTKLKDLTEQQLSDKTIKIDRKFRIIKRRLKENKILQRYAERFGSDKFNTFLNVQSLDYIKSMAPVWAMCDDDRKIRIGKIVLEGLPEVDNFVIIK